VVNFITHKFKNFENQRINSNRLERSNQKSATL